jgi:signal transduction histidine kinase
MDAKEPHLRVVPAITAGSYLVAGIAWIWGSEAAGRALFTGLDDCARYQAVKGFGFVFVTALVLFLWLLANCRAVERHDLHMREEAQRELERRTAELVAANRALESFTYSVAHDLRAPVAHVDGFAKALEDTIRNRDPERAWHYTQRIVSNARLMAEMIEGILQVSRVERATPQRKPVEMAPMVRNVVEELAADPKVAILARCRPWRATPRCCGRCGRTWSPMR